MKTLYYYINVNVFQHKAVVYVGEMFENEHEGKTYTQDDMIYIEEYPVTFEGWQDIMKDVSYFQKKYNAEAKFYGERC